MNSINKIIITLLALIYVSCAPVYEIYVSPGEIATKVGDKKIVSVDTTKIYGETILHVRYRD